VPILLLMLKLLFCLAAFHKNHDYATQGMLVRANAETIRSARCIQSPGAVTWTRRYTQEVALGFVVLPSTGLR